MRAHPSRLPALPPEPSGHATHHHPATAPLRYALSTLSKGERVKSQPFWIASATCWRAAANALALAVFHGLAVAEVVMMSAPPASTFS